MAVAKYLVTYHGEGMPSDPAMIEQAKSAFGAWLGEAGSAVLDPGAPVHYVESVSISGTWEPADLGGYSIIQADSPEEAKKLLSTHPFVTHGGTLAVHEVMTI